jgi:hypothetical protein
MLLARRAGSRCSKLLKNSQNENSRNLGCDPLLRLEDEQGHAWRVQPLPSSGNSFRWREPLPRCQRTNPAIDRTLMLAHASQEYGRAADRPAIFTE